MTSVQIFSSVEERFRFGPNSERNCMYNVTDKNTKLMHWIHLELTMLILKVHFLQDCSFIKSLLSYMPNL